ncbi:tRNA synthetases class I (C) catalytic domain-containing protein, partial [Piptocephalis cylindrospora]
MSSSTSTVKQPEWRVPTNSAPASPLRILNSLTRTKTEVVPRQGKRLTWYNCGPTVYDASHLGHARTYLTVDILRRILTDYFQFDVLFVMNITDIDDKIILRSRQAHLLRTWRDKHAESGEVDSALQQAVEAYNSYVSGKLGGSAASALLSSIAADPKAFPALPFVPADPAAPVDPVDEGKWAMHVAAARKAYVAITTLSSSSAPAEERMGVLTEGAGDVIAPWLDTQLGSTVSHSKIFKAHAAFWERDFFQDMKALRVRPADIVTRVSEYIPEIVQFVEKIIERGYAYEADGSVYFDVAAFKASPRHDYAKLEPWAAGSANLLEEGEGSLGSKLRGKRAAADFALWKQSKDGEPSWTSPWGPGRPGWHIECSAMASEVLGETMDIHSGGIDLAFPHHDNELAQSEAYHECDQWVNYFIHPGHLHIEGQKMSKSLKNFITIKEALARHTARQLRLTFLLHPWESRLDFRESGMEEAKGVEGTLKKFFLNVRSTLSEIRAKEEAQESRADVHGYGDRERALVAELGKSQLAVHEALADSIDTPTALRHLLDLVSRVNIYMLEAARDTGVNGEVIGKVASYVTRMMQVRELGGGG